MSVLGRVAYDAGAAAPIVGRNSNDIEMVLDPPGCAALIYRGDMALGGE